jgi:hypothetical protein
MRFRCFCTIARSDRSSIKAVAKSPGSTRRFPARNSGLYTHRLVILYLLLAHEWHPATIRANVIYATLDRESQN